MAAEAIGFEPRLMDQRRGYDALLDRQWIEALDQADRRLAGIEGPYDPALGDAPVVVVKRGSNGRLHAQKAGEKRWSRAVEDRFFATLAMCGNIGASARAVGFSQSCIDQRRRKWPDFARRLEEALDDAEVEIEFRVAAEVQGKRGARRRATGDRARAARHGRGDAVPQMAAGEEGRARAAGARAGAAEHRGGDGEDRPQGARRSSGIDGGAGCRRPAVDGRGTKRKALRGSRIAVPGQIGFPRRSPLHHPSGGPPPHPAMGRRDASIIQCRRWKGLDEQELRRVLASLTEAERRVLDGDWPSWAHEGQLAPGGEWRTWTMLAGRGFGKTKAGAEWVSAFAREPSGRLDRAGRGDGRRKLATSWSRGGAGFSRWRGWEEREAMVLGAEPAAAGLRIRRPGLSLFGGQSGRAARAGASYRLVRRACEMAACRGGVGQSPARAPARRAAAGAGHEFPPTRPYAGKKRQAVSTVSPRARNHASLRRAYGSVASPPSASERSY